MCQICNGTRKVHEINSFGYRTSCCPECGPMETELWLEQQKARKDWIAEMRKKGGSTYGKSRSVAAKS
ncbi:hypothetical protein [Neobacillus massiliamazoniensis]|uniref:Uncharacterized protein n=1 Tax=Neobacillus massiliamazoniensis TaxID=1499688 RepID=A0A0U1NQM5_9BACI|nr:hypothetical protein [Neobacillus massiliamazoniensis]CRK80337.1 hypothetical protein BN000_00218 [Neobacillus massiliamazoniensis]